MREAKRNGGIRGPEIVEVYHSKMPNSQPMTGVQGSQAEPGVQVERFKSWVDKLRRLFCGLRVAGLIGTPSPWRFSKFLKRGSIDEVRVYLNGLCIDFRRFVKLDVPHEVTVVIPRAEISETYKDGKLSEVKIVLSSITVVHAPRHPLAGPPPGGGTEGSPLQTAR